MLLVAACGCFGEGEPPVWLGQVGVVTQAAALLSAWLVVAPHDAVAVDGQAVAHLVAERGPANAGTGLPWQPHWRLADSQQQEFATRCGQLPRDGAAADVDAVHPLLQTPPCSPLMKHLHQMALSLPPNHPRTVLLLQGVRVLPCLQRVCHFWPCHRPAGPQQTRLAQPARHG